MATVFITGSTEGLGRWAAQSLLGAGHGAACPLGGPGDEPRRTSAAGRGIVIGELCSADQTRSIADQVNGIGRMDAIIHNAGVYTEGSRGPTPEGHAGVLA